MAKNMLSQEEKQLLRDRMAERAAGHRSCRLSPRDIVAIGRAYANGESPSTIARRFEVSTQTIHYHLRKLLESE